MHRFRIVVKGDDGRKHTRHVRAKDELHADQQAKAIAAVIGKNATIGKIERMAYGRVESIQRGGRR